MARVNQHVGACSIEDIEKIEHRLREVDVSECMALGQTGPEALREGFKNSAYIKAIFVDFEPVAAFGVTKHPVDETLGVVWMLGTDDIVKAFRTLTRLGHKYVDEMLNVRPTLYNYVAERNTISIRWLESLGFQIGKAVPFGKNKESFKFFHKVKGAKDV